MCGSIRSPMLLQAPAITLAELGKWAYLRLKKKKKNALALVFKSSISFKNHFSSSQKELRQRKEVDKKNTELRRSSGGYFPLSTWFCNLQDGVNGIRSVKVYKFFFIKLQINIQLVLTNCQQRYKAIISYYIIYITIQSFIKRELGI